MAESKVAQLTRYRTGGYGAMVEDDNGPWVRADVAADLLASLKETLEACAALMRAVHLHGSDPIVDEWALQLRLVEIADGFGARADDAIAKAEGR